MVTPYEALTEGARLARELAARCLSEAKEADTDRAIYLTSEADRHNERADWYEHRAQWFAPKIEQEIAA